jgi:hypothetical protein
LLYVSIIVELLRARPALTVGLAIGAQAALWTLIPGVFYAGPPGDLPMVLALGHELRLGFHLGPPLADALAELVFDLAGHRLIAIYALSQACVAAAYWAIFRLGRAIVGARQAALAVLLMVGISSFTVAAPDFGTPVLAMPLWALALSHYWLIVKEPRWNDAIVLALALGLLLLVTDAALLLIGLMVVFTLANPHTRALLRSGVLLRPNGLMPAAIVVALLIGPLIMALTESADGVWPTLLRLSAPAAVLGDFYGLLQLSALIVGAHAGLILLVGIVIGFPWSRPAPAPVIVREPIEPSARQFVYFFAVMPALLATIAGAVLGGGAPLGGVAPLIVLSGLAIVVAAGDAIELSHQRLVIATWLGLLLAPPILTLVALATLPWLGIDLAINQPAGAIARFFADSFERRVGKPLPIVAGDPRTAALIALAAGSRPSVYFDAEPARPRSISMRDLTEKGAIVVWPTSDTAGIPPPAIKDLFPSLVPEVPRTFTRPVQGQLPLLRLGWAVIRPQAAPDAPAAAAAPNSGEAPRTN